MDFLNRALWLMAKCGRCDEMQKLLDLGAKVDFEWVGGESSANLDSERHEEQHHPDGFFQYKGRQVSCQALHVAAAYSGSDICPEGGWDKSKQAVRLLLEARAEVSAVARPPSRVLQAIHIAAGMGNRGTVELLLERRADPDAEALMNDRPHYAPIHDAAWYDRVHCVECLLNCRAQLDIDNYEGNTALHIAAKLGYPRLVRLLLDRCHDMSLQRSVRRELTPHLRRSSLQFLDSRGLRSKSVAWVFMKNHYDQSPLELAVVHARFPPRELHIFTRDLDQSDRAKAFKIVANSCPAAASAILRSVSQEEDEDGIEVHENFVPIDPIWQRSIAKGAECGEINAQILAEFIEHAPQAAVDLIDALSCPPRVLNQEHHPLPLRVKIPRSSDFCRMLCAYEKDMEWVWVDGSKNHDGGRPWHKTLAPADPKRGLEASVRVFKIKGILDMKVIHCLAVTTDTRIFTKLMIHALLKFTWANFRILFVMDMVHNLLTMLVISCWIWSPRDIEPSEMGKRALWCCVASQGLVEFVNLAYTCGNSLLHPNLGRKALIKWMHQVWHRPLICIWTLMLAASTPASLWPSQDASVMLATNSLLHWVGMLFELRAFQWTGRRLLPIMKSVTPIAGMLVLMLFLMNAFLHAFWAMNPGNSDELTFFNVGILLFSGEGFIESDDLQTMEFHKRMVIILLTLSAVFFFVACAMNVFIAVLSDCYEQEQERMVCTFLKERACICEGIFLRPVSSWVQNWDADRPQWQGWMAACSMAAGLLGIYVALLKASADGAFSVWFPALFLTGALLLSQVVLRSTLAPRWDDRYLWYVHESSVEEDMFLADNERNRIENNGRIARIKRYMLEQCRGICFQSRNLKFTLKMTKLSLIQKLEGLASRIDELLSPYKSQNDFEDEEPEPAPPPKVACGPPAAPASEEVHAVLEKANKKHQARKAHESGPSASSQSRELT
mmetsp:Transcript_6542/g.13514  ORF Transcript_6542/g.13514 Transcript_6542/m.13514 type:complete len:952 (-) Transcript_6542:46-2901(-)